MKNFKKTLAYKICGYFAIIILIVTFSALLLVFCSVTMWQSLILTGVALWLFQIIPYIVLPIFILLSIIGSLTQKRYDNKKNNITTKNFVFKWYEKRSSIFELLLFILNIEPILFDCFLGSVQRCFFAQDVQNTNHICTTSSTCNCCSDCPHCNFWFNTFFFPNTSEYFQFVV